MAGRRAHRVINVPHEKLLEVRILLTPREVAEILGISKSYVYLLCEQGTLEAVRIPAKTLRIRTESVKKLLDRGSRE
jgi:excisionase family DNA binding protein